MRWFMIIYYSIMQGSSWAILSVQILNLIITLIFFILFTIRNCQIQPMGITNKYSDTEWLKRSLISAIYILVSAAMLTIELVDEKDSAFMRIVTSGSLGFCVNSVLLIMHIVVVKRELNRELPFTGLHQHFLASVFIICTARLGILIYLSIDNTLVTKTVLLSLSCVQVVISIVMLVYWVRKKRNLPIFQDFAKMDTGTITSKLNLPLLLDFSSMGADKTVDRWNLIKPNVSVQKGEIRIILESYADDSILKNLCSSEETKNDMDGKSVSNKSKQHLQIISDHHYSKKELQKMYLVCCRFDLDSRVDFEESSIAVFYMQVKKFIEQLFTLKQVYIPQMFQMFHIDRESVAQLTKNTQSLVKNKSQLLISQFIDFNALFVSIEVFKQMWDRDHFIFFIHSISMDRKDVAVSYKRYSDFEDFHHRLQERVEEERKSLYIMPNLPKKHFFSWSNAEESKANERRVELQAYCRQAFNDHEIMTKLPRSRQLIFEFLGLKKVFQISPNYAKALDYYDGLEVEKGNIYKALVEEEYVTFYEFEIIKNGIKIRSIFKRFRDFISMQQAIERWMKNTQIVYKSIALPQKHLYKSQTKRHSDLKIYLQNLLSVKEAYKIYEINRFFMMGAKYDGQGNGIGLSIIRRQASNIDQQSSVKDIFEESGGYQVTGEEQRMSLLIEQLGD